jgi:hypothetical protein
MPRKTKQQKANFNNGKKGGRLPLAVGDIFETEYEFFNIDEA